MMSLEPRETVSVNFQQPQATGRDPEARSGVGPKKPMTNEVVPRRARRRFTAAEKLRLLAEADKCAQHGELGAMLRREGIYSSHLATWRVQRDHGDLSGKKRGRRPKPVNPLAGKLAEAEKQNQKLQKKLEEAQLIIAFQKKFLEMFGEMPNSSPDKANS